MSEGNAVSNPSPNGNGSAPSGQAGSAPNAAPASAPATHGVSTGGSGYTRAQLQDIVNQCISRGTMNQTVGALEMKKAGFAPEYQPATPAPDPVPAAGGNQPPPPKYTPSQAETIKQAVRECVARGLTPEKAEAILREEGLQPSAPDPAVPQTVRELDSFYPRAKPEDFYLPPPNAHGEALTPEHAKFDSERRTWLSGARFTKEQGESFWNMVDGAAMRFRSKSEPEQKAYISRENQSLMASLGPTAYERLSLARLLLDELDAKAPGVRKHLIATGAFEDSMVVTQLVRQAELMLSRSNQFRKSKSVEELTPKEVFSRYTKGSKA